MTTGIGDAMGKRVEIQCFGILREVCGGEQREVTVASLPTSVAEILEKLATEVPAARGYLAHTACAVGDRVVKRDAQVAAGDTLVLLPPVSGG